MTEENRPELTMSCTKKEMLDVYEQMKKQLIHQQKTIDSAEEFRKQVEEKEALRAAEGCLQQEPLQQIFNLRSELGRKLNELADGFEREVEAYKQVRKSVVLKQEELQSLYGIEAAAIDLEILIKAQQHKKAEFEDKMAMQDLAFERQKMRDQESWELEKQEWKAKIKESSARIARERQRDEEEYNYSLAREREQREDILRADMATLEEEISLKRKRFEEEMELRVTELDQREMVFAEKEAELSELRERLDAVPAQFKAAVAEEVQKVESRLAKEYNSREQLLNETFESEKSLMQNTISSLENVVDEQAASIKELTLKQESAFVAVQEIARKAVGANAQKFSIYSNEPLEQTE